MNEAADHSMQKIKEVVVKSILDICPNFGITANSKLKDIGASLKSAGLTKMAASSNTAARVSIHSQYDRITGQKTLQRYLDGKKQRSDEKKERVQKRQKRRKNKKKRVREAESLISPVKVTRPKPKEDFLDSWEWKKLRYEVLKEFGRRCMCCGATPETGAVICVDHIKPRHTHSELKLERSNLQVLCYDCNKGKGAWDQTDWRPKAEYKPN